MMDRLVRRTFTKGLILLPYFIANVVVALVWFWMLDAQLGIVNQFLEAIGLSGQSWFGNPKLVIPTVALINVWRHMGYTAIPRCSSMRGCKPFPSRSTRPLRSTVRRNRSCLLYTSDAADEEDSVDLG